MGRRRWRGRRRGIVWKKKLEEMEDEEEKGIVEEEVAIHLMSHE